MSMVELLELALKLPQEERAVLVHELLRNLQPGQRIPTEFSAACREAVTFAQRLATGQVEAPSPDLLALAKQAQQQCDARKNEDVQAWAEQLARDVGNAMDCQPVESRRFQAQLP
jgi:hypothetical protein